MEAVVNRDMIFFVSGIQQIGKQAERMTG